MGNIGSARDYRDIHLVKCQPMSLSLLYPEGPLHVYFDRLIVPSVVCPWCSRSGISNYSPNPNGGGFRGEVIYYFLLEHG